MNPFRSRKKSFNDGDSRRPSVDDAPPVPLGFRGRTFRKKKNQPEPKKDVDIKAALPPTDDFRTSLLMPNLSARFSMLREQDDPNTKIGKANDDSVLFPKRASKLNLFGNNELSEIAEVASISDSIRPPMAPFARERTQSYSSADGYGTDDDSKSIMSRSRQVKGNKFFANRQKVYMIPAEGSASVKDLQQGPKLNDKAARSMGKVVYDADINISAIQAYAPDNAGGRPSEDKPYRKQSSDDDRERSDHNSKRETSSSTNSGPLESRASTAATSVASQAASPMHGPASNGAGFPFNKPSFSNAGPDRSVKGKRLYGQGLDQHMHEQQTSALQRLNSIQRPFGMTQSRSATNLNDRFHKPGQLYSTNNFRAMSPVPGSSNSLAGFDFGTEDTRSRSNSRDVEYTNNASPTMSPPMSPTDPTLIASLEPNDLGKATATGAFNKPKTSYSDEQFAKRQMQLQEGRETPPPSSFSRPGVYSSLGTRDRNGSLASQISAHSAGSQAKDQLPLQTPNAASNLRKAESAGGATEPASGAYLASRSDSELGSEPNSPIDLASLKFAAQSAMSRAFDPAVRHRKYEHDDQHPAFSRPLDPTEEDSASEVTQLLPLQSTDASATGTDASASNIVDSPTLPVNDQAFSSSGGLNDLIRGHLRNVSNTSSVYPNSPPRQSHEFFLDGPDAVSIEKAAKMPGHPADMQQTGAENGSVESLSERARRILEQASQLKSASTKPYEVLGGVGVDKVQQILGGEAPRRSNEGSRASNSGWQEGRGHTRGASTETQKEREDFANELADRRKQVQDNLKNFVEDDDSSPSPVGFRNTENGSARAGPLGLLKKASRGSIVGRSEGTSKAMKMLGVGSTANAAPATSPQPNVVSPEGFAGNRPVLNGDIRHRVPRPADQPFKVRPGNGPSFRDRSIGAERRGGFFRGPSPSPNQGPERAASAKQPSPKPNGYGFVRANTDNFTNAQPQGQFMGRLRKYSPPAAGARSNDHFGNVPHAVRSASAQGHYSPAGQSSFHTNGSYFPSQPRSPHPPNSPFASPFIESPGSSPLTGAFPIRGTPPTEQAPNLRNASSSQHLRGQQPRKRSINKDEISNPTFLSGTSTVITVDLPAGASLSNGMDQVRADAPPVPPINPRRRKNAPTQNLFTSFVSKSSNNLTAMSTPSSAATSPHSGTPFLHGAPHDEMSTFSSDENEPKHRSRTRLRKVSSDGGNMAARARHQALKDMDRMPRSPMYAVDSGAQRMF